MLSGHMRYRRLAWYGVASVLLATSASAEVVKVSLNGLEIGIDGDSGSVVSLRSPHTGEILAAAPDGAGLLDVAYPDRELRAHAARVALFESADRAQ